MDSTPRKPADFYDGLAKHYDEMISFENRLAAADGWVRAYVQRFGNVASAVDIGCGTGVYALAMAKPGVEVFAADVSAGMIEKARAHAGAKGQSLHWIQAGLESLSPHLPAAVDLMVCMGNTLPHILSPQTLGEGLCELAGRLAPEGRIVLQLLNYEKILAQRERVVEINRSGDVEFIRFYDFLDPRVRFNLLEIDWGNTQPTHRLDATELYPYRREELEELLNIAGLKNIRAFGGLDFAEFSPQQSETLMLIAGR